MAVGVLQAAGSRAGAREGVQGKCSAPDIDSSAFLDGRCSAAGSTGRS